MTLYFHGKLTNLTPPNIQQGPKYLKLWAKNTSCHLSMSTTMSIFYTNINISNHRSFSSSKGHRKNDPEIWMEFDGETGHCRRCLKWPISPMLIMAISDPPSNCPICCISTMCREMLTTHSIF